MQVTEADPASYDCATTVLVTGGSHETDLETDLGANSSFICAHVFDPQLRGRRSRSSRRLYGRRVSLLRFGDSESRSHHRLSKAEKAEYQQAMPSGDERQRPLDNFYAPQLKSIPYKRTIERRAPMM